MHPFDGIDLRAHPEAYHIGRGEYGVFHAEPYKGELLPLWAFRTPNVARASADALHARYLAYRAEEDFVGMDVARKFLQMGFTRARRYANHAGGRKYAAGGAERARGPEDPAKAEAAAIFGERWREVAADPEYLRLKGEHQRRAQAPRADLPS